MALAASPSSGSGSGSGSPPAPPPATDSLARLAPPLFVVLWSTGFIGARAVLPHAEPFTILALRFACTVALLVPLAGLMRSRWPARLSEAGHAIVVGVLVHGVYLGGVFYAVDRGMPAGLVALVAGLQPILTALLAGPMLGERTQSRQWLGLGLGLVGVALVLSEKLVGPDPGAAGGVGLTFSGFGPQALIAAGCAVVGIAAGTLYQKRFCQGVDLVTASVLQFAGAAVVITPFALILETGVITWTLQTVIGFAWLVGGLSLGAVSLLLVLIRRGAAAGVASLFYLVPPVTAVLANLIYDERLGPVALVGMAVAALGVALVVGRIKPATRT